ncbi:hypothetical protein FBEOM_3423 [Fusarium beomiforme]|uniref:Uncharacterized protein n=1 Tax=Fusarium beomiforme TaxID=44412 RepID=A0A9P5APS7_9HYPO|nr:hypothetical protein FBEOM_3423 [Fusarium beomiforme]
MNEHPGLLSMWETKEVLASSDTPYHVAHVLVNLIYTNNYQNLCSSSQTENECTMTDFTTAIYAYRFGEKLCLPSLSVQAGERLVIYGDKLPFLEIVKKLSGQEFKEMSFTGGLYDYICQRASVEGSKMNATNASEVQKVMGETMAGILCKRIANLEAENRHLLFSDVMVIKKPFRLGSLFFPDAVES